MEEGEMKHITSYFIQVALVLALGLAVSGCTLFVTNANNNINDRPLEADWKLVKSKVPLVGQCVIKSISVCNSTKSEGLVSITSDDRVSILRSLQEKKENEKSGASIVNGYAVLTQLRYAVLTKRRDAVRAKSQELALSGGAKKELGVLEKELGVLEVDERSKLKDQVERLKQYLGDDDLYSALAAHLHDNIPLSWMKKNQVSASLVAGAKHAEGALSGTDACVELDRILSNTAGTNQGGSFSVGKESFRDCLKQTRDATGLDGWSALTAHYANTLAVEVERIKKEEKGATQKKKDTDKKIPIVLAREAVAASLVGEYMKAYFNNGNIFAVDLKVGTLEQDAMDAIRKHLGITDARAIEKLTDNLLQQILGTKPDENGVYHLLVKKNDGGFVTRAGATFMFPGISVTLDPKSNTPVALSKIDLVQIGSDMIRILIEGLGDGWSMIPGDPKSTGVAVAQLPRYEPPKDDKSKYLVTQDQFTSINDWSNKVEGVVGSATGQAIRGISWISLNNEALAKMIETAVGVAARKGTERLAWCIYQCSQCSPKESPLERALNDLEVNNATLRLENR
jgi:hypothetical protein